MAMIVLTGYSGLLGRAVLTQLEASGHQVICVGRHPPRASTARHIAADLANDDFASALPAKADAIIHLAQAEGYNQFPERSLHVFRVNVGSVAALLDWGNRAGIGHFVHASTGGVYGGGAEQLTEQHPLDLTGSLAHYFASKRSAELLAQSFAGLFAVVALRYFFIYGADQKPGMLIPRLVDNVRNGRPLKLLGDDGIRLNPIHVSDAAAATIAALRVPAVGGIFNVAGPETLTMRGIGETIGEALGLPVKFERDGIGAPRHLVADTASMRAGLVVPRVRFRDGIADLCR